MNEFFTQYAYLIVPFIKIALLVLVVLTVDAYLTWLERKVPTPSLLNGDLDRIISRSGLTMGIIDAMANIITGVMQMDPNLCQCYHTAMNVALMDGSVRTISNNVDSKILEALGTPAGGEDVSKVD